MEFKFAGMDWVELGLIIMIALILIVLILSFL